MIALVIGGSRTVWEEFEAAKTLIGVRPHVVIATNNAGWSYQGRIDAWATLHPEMYEGWRSERAGRGLNTDYREFMYAGRKAVAGTEARPQRWGRCSSGLFGAQVALDDMDCAGVILCGVPLDEDAGHFHDPGPWALAKRYRPGAEKAKAEGAPIRSMSGWTAGLFGRPDEEWLESVGC